MQPQRLLVWDCDAGSTLEFSGHLYKKINAAPSLGFWFYIPA